MTSGSLTDRSLKLSLTRKLAYSVIAVTAFFGILELVLLAAGVEPRIATEDPFVGFAPGVPLFVETSENGAAASLTTNALKRGFFNTQSFPAEKSPDAFRIFCLGGSTTYGRPYADGTSFCGWLRELLPAADLTRDWQVVNAGGISYASYRVAELMSELVDYEPDLFIVYTGHNEFLEERTYGEIRDLPRPVTAALGLVARTRTGAVLEATVEFVGKARRGREEDRSILPTEVQAKLDHSAGLDLYVRDDTLANEITEHFSYSLERMWRQAASVHAELLLVQPASNLKDWSPFKSQPTDGLSNETVLLHQARLETVDAMVADDRWEEALAILDDLAVSDPRHAGVHFLRGRALLQFGRQVEAEQAFTRARDEDVCPLRALSDFQKVLASTATRLDIEVIDAVDLFRGKTFELTGQPAAGSELFFDHVHPTIEGHRLLAAAIIDSLIARGIVRPGEMWGEEAVRTVAQRVEAAVGQETHARSLANLALTLSWAGKQEESRRLAFQALEAGATDPTVFLMVARHHAVEGRDAEAREFFRRAELENPGNPVIHSQVGLYFAGRGELEAAAAHFFLASLLLETNASYHQQLGWVMSRRGRLREALPSLEEALRLDPGNSDLARRVQSVRERLEAGVAEPERPEINVTRYDSGYPKTIAQTRRDPSGVQVLDGIWTEWLDGGGLSGFADYRNGRRTGVAVAWDEEGQEVSRVVAADS